MKYRLLSADAGGEIQAGPILCPLHLGRKVRVALASFRSLPSGAEVQIFGIAVSFSLAM